MGDLRIYCQIYYISIHAPREGCDVVLVDFIRI